MSPAAPAPAPMAAAPARSPAGPEPALVPGPRWRRAAARLDARRLPGWAQALVVLAASRLLYTWVTLRCVDLAGWHRDGTHWTYLQIANNWDGVWYRKITLEGYPHALPHDATGAVVPNTWAFYPLYPQLARAVEALGLGWEAAATIVSLVAAAATAVLVRSVTARVAGPRLALWTVVFLCFFPSALVLQLPYSEALALALLAAAFWCLQRERYLLAVPVVLLLGLARPIASPLAVVLTVHLAVRVRAAWGLRPGALGRTLWGPAVAWLAGAVAAVAWPLIVWWVTGVPDGYTRTMAAWRAPRQVVPVQPLIAASEVYLGRHVGPLALVAGVVALAWWLVRVGRNVVRRDLAVWCGAYAAYLLAVLDSFTSLPRYLLPLFPLGTMLASASGSRAFRLAVTIAFGVLGVVWMLAIWRSHHWAP